MRAGLEDLCKQEPRFAAFRESLFSQASVALNRDLQTREVNDKIDVTVDSLLLLLSDHFLSPAAFKVLEYLIRRYK